jgi:hypothetical protein
MGLAAPNVVDEGALILTISTPMEAPLSQLQFNGLPGLTAPQQLIIKLLLSYLADFAASNSINEYRQANGFLQVPCDQHLKLQRDLCKEDQFSELHCVKSLRICVF